MCALANKSVQPPFNPSRVLLLLGLEHRSAPVTWTCCTHWRQGPDVALCCEDVTLTWGQRSAGIKHTAQGLALAFILLIVWLLYYGRTCAVLMSVYSGNLWSRYLVEERASHTSADHVYNQASIEPRVGQSKAGSVRSVEMVPRLPNVRDGRL